jgi:hypothetical protein
LEDEEGNIKVSQFLRASFVMSPENDYELIRESFSGKKSFHLGKANKFEKLMMDEK